MPTIQITDDELLKRISYVPRMLQPLANPTSRLACQFFPGLGGVGIKIIGAHQGGIHKSHYRDWRFSTFLNDYRGMFFELWKSENGRDFYLVQMCLSLFYIDRIKHDETELLALHCNPEEPLNTPHAEYKKGPHIHVKAAELPISRAHFSLTCGYLEAILSSPASLMNAIEWAIVMLKKQILDKAAK